VIVSRTVRTKATGRLLRDANDQAPQFVDPHEAPGLRVVRVEIPAGGLTVVPGAIRAQDHHFRIADPIEPAFGRAAAAPHVECADGVLQSRGEALAKGTCRRRADRHRDLPLDRQFDEGL
jgi:hypothetical protein